MKGTVLAMPRSARLDLFLQAFWVALVPGALLFAWMQVRGYADLGMIGVDSHAYWLAARDPASWYTRPPATWDAYLYSPAFAQVLWPFGHLPWHVFQALWLAAQLAVVVWLLRPLGWRRTLVLIPFLTGELLLGNLYVFFGAALVLTVTGRPGALALPLLTKVTPGVAGLWFVVRRDWRAAGWAFASTAAVVGLSLLLDAGAWGRWVHFLLSSSDSDRGTSTMVRLAVAAVLVVVAGRTNRSWLLAPALILACPVLGGWNYLATLTALPRLFARDRAARESAAVSEPADEAAVSNAGHPGAAVLQA